MMQSCRPTAPVGKQIPASSSWTAAGVALRRGTQYLKENHDIEVGLVLPNPDVPLRIAAPDDLAAPMAPERRVLDRQCPGPDADTFHTG